MRRLIVGISLIAVAVAAAAAYATEDPIFTRKSLMDANGAAAGAGSAMMKGEAPSMPRSLSPCSRRCMPSLTPTATISPPAPTKATRRRARRSGKTLRASRPRWPSSRRTRTRRSRPSPKTSKRSRRRLVRWRELQGLSRRVPAALLVGHVAEGGLRDRDSRLSRAPPSPGSSPRRGRFRRRSFRPTSRTSRTASSCFMPADARPATPRRTRRARTS